MRLRIWLLTPLFPLVGALAFLPAADEKKAALTDDTGITWKKTVLDRAFRSEGVAIADVNRDGKWKQHETCKSACNETPLYADLFGTGKRVLIMGYLDKQIIWAAPGKDPTQPWEIHPISNPEKAVPAGGHFAHGLGVGDLNGD